MSKPAIDPAWAERLATGLQALDLHPSPLVSEQLLQFIALLYKWNSAFNLTAVTDPLEMVERHLLDSLSILPHLEGRRFLDMGTGAGLPGIPLALMLPESEFVLLDSNIKKIRFVRQAVMELGVKNVQLVHSRLERFESDESFDVLISRAFSSLQKMLELSGKLMGEQTRLLAMKGSVPMDDIEQISADYLVRVIGLEASFTAGQRHLICVTRKHNRSD